MATIGYTSIGSNSTATGTNWNAEALVHANHRYTAVSGDTVTEVAVYGDDTGAARIAIYEFSGGVPTNKVGSDITVTIGSAAGWYTAAANIALTNGVNYCVAISYTTGVDESWNIRYDSPGIGTTQSTESQSDLPATWGEASTFTDAVSFYATVTASGATLEPPFIASTATLYAPNVSPGPVTLGPPAIASTEQLFSPTVTQPGTGLTMPFLSSTATLFGSTLTPGPVTLTVPFRSSTTVVHPPSVSQIRYPASISNRKILDQAGRVFLMRTVSSWSLVDLSDADITTALEGVVSRGFNAVTVWAGGGYTLDATWDPRYERKADSTSWWTGTAWASTFGGAWNGLDHVADECLRLGLVLNISLCGGNGSSGARPDWDAVTDTNMHDVGVAIATRYASYPNIVWHVMFDDTITATTAARIEAYFDGINDTEGASTRPFRWAEPGNSPAPGSVYTQVIEPGLMPSFAPANGYYDNAFNSSGWMNRTEIVEASYNQSGATTLVTGDTEPAYDGSPYISSGNAGQYLREQTYACFIEGGSYINYSQEDWWPFGKSGWVISTEGLDWTDFAGHSHTIQQQHAWTLLDTYVADTSWVPDDGTFLTSTHGTGNTKRAAGHSNTSGLVYVSSTGSLTVDLTIFTYAAARVRWFDPTSGEYTNVGVFPTTSSQVVVAHPGLNDDGQNDWILVVDESTEGQLFPPVIGSTASLFAPTVTPATIVLVMPTIATTQILAPNVSPAAVNVTVPLLAATTALFVPTLVGGNVQVDLPLIDPTTVLYAPSVFNGLFPPVIGSSTVLYAPVVTLGFVPIDAPAFVVTRRTVTHIVRRPDDPVITRGPYTNWPGV